MRPVASLKLAEAPKFGLSALLGSLDLVRPEYPIEIL